MSKLSITRNLINMKLQFFNLVLQSFWLIFIKILVVLCLFVCLKCDIDEQLISNYKLSKNDFYYECTNDFSQRLFNESIINFTKKRMYEISLAPNSSFTIIILEGEFGSDLTFNYFLHEPKRVSHRLPTHRRGAHKIFFPMILLIYDLKFKLTVLCEGRYEAKG